MNEILNQVQDDDKCSSFRRLPTPSFRWSLNTESLEVKSIMNEILNQVQDDDKFSSFRRLPSSSFRWSLNTESLEVNKITHEILNQVQDDDKCSSFRKSPAPVIPLVTGPPHSVGHHPSHSVGGLIRNLMT
jgi:hypothetical protein